LKKCKYGFPFEKNSTLRLEISGKRFLYIRKDEEDKSVVPYIPELLLLANAHVNAQYPNKKDWILYLVSYTTKLGKSYSVKLKKDIKITSGDHFIRMRDVSIMECANCLSGFKTTERSHEVLHLETNFNPNFKMLKRRKQLLELPANSKDIFTMNKLDKYMIRPQQYKDVSYSDFYRNYTFDYKSKQYKKRNQPAVVRWK